jgi:hypothetical protein
MLQRPKLMKRRGQGASMLSPDVSDEPKVSAGGGTRIRAAPFLAHGFSSLPFRRARRLRHIAAQGAAPAQHVASIIASNTSGSVFARRCQTRGRCSATLWFESQMAELVTLDQPSLECKPSEQTCGFETERTCAATSSKVLDNGTLSDIVNQCEPRLQSKAIYSINLPREACQFFERVGGIPARDSDTSPWTRRGGFSN